MPATVDAPVLDPALAEAVARPFESFSSEQQAEMLKRLDYEGLRLQLEAAQPSEL
jgi:hypothetical protein